MMRIIILAIVLVFASQAARGQQAIVSFTFDDAPKSVVRVGLPILAAHGFPATVYVSTRNTTRSGYMNWEDVAFAVRHGWEVGAHTHTHPKLTQLTNEQILEELLTSTLLFAKHGYAPAHFASPFGHFDERVLEILRRYYESHRTAWPNGVNTLPLKDPYKILSFVFTQKTTIAQVVELLRNLRDTGGWVVFQLHHLTPKGEEVREKYGTNLLEETVELVRAQGFTVLTVGSVLQQLKGVK